MDFSARLKKLLEERAMSQKELAAKAGITESALSHYIKGDRFPRSTTAALLAEALDTNVDYLLGHMPSEKSLDDFNAALVLLARIRHTLTKEQKMAIIELLV